MKSVRKKPFYKILAAPWLTLLLLIVIGVSISVATFIESSLGTAASKSQVYNARWFELVLAFFGLNLVLALGRWWPFRPRLMGFVLIHIAVIVILIGAATTRFFGFEGTMYLREGGSTQVIYSRDFHIIVGLDGDQASFPVRLYGAGPQNIQRKLLVAGETLTVQVVEYWENYGMNGASDDPNASAAVSLRVVDETGAEGAGVFLASMGETNSVKLGERIVGLGYGPVKINLPFQLQLDDFVMITYPGSDNPVDYESHVSIFDQEQGIDGRPARIYMNHPLTHRGYKHFQSSYDRDRKGSILTVNYDPGKWPTYIGYLLITLGFVLVFAKDLLWPSRRSGVAKGASS